MGSCVSLPLPWGPGGQPGVVPCRCPFRGGQAGSRPGAGAATRRGSHEAWHLPTAQAEPPPLRRGPGAASYSEELAWAGQAGWAWTLVTLSLETGSPPCPEPTELALAPGACGQGLSPASSCLPGCPFEAGQERARFLNLCGGHRPCDTSDKCPIWGQNIEGQTLPSPHPEAKLKPRPPPPLLPCSQCVEHRDPQDPVTSRERVDPSGQAPAECLLND